MMKDELTFNKERRTLLLLFTTSEMSFTRYKISIFSGV